MKDQQKYLDFYFYNTLHIGVKGMNDRYMKIYFKDLEKYICNTRFVLVEKTYNDEIWFKPNTIYNDRLKEFAKLYSKIYIKYSVEKI